MKQQIIVVKFHSHQLLVLNVRVQNKTKEIYTIYKLTYYSQRRTKRYRCVTIVNRVSLFGDETI